jgi:hypothetical protein
VRNRRAALGIALLAAGFPPLAGAQTVVVGPQGAAVTAPPSGQFTVPVVADMTASGGASLGSIAARITWRADALKFVGATLGTAGSPTFSADSATGTLRFALANAAGATGMPILINATFQALEQSGDTTELITVVDEIAAAGTFADLLPITTATRSLFCVGGGLYGDIDNTATLTSFDALLIVTSAVGLSIAPFTTANGDVDNDGKADTRDALIVLTYVVGLPTTGTRVGQPVTGACGSRGPASVDVLPATVEVSVGDRFPLSTVVLDSTGAIGFSAAPQWLSRDQLVATVDATGGVIGVAAGSTQAVAILAPGIMDSATVTVTAARRVWYVDPAIAAGNPVELGSQLYPFSNIGEAIAAAAAGDTIIVAVSSYGEALRIDKPLTIIGDSGASGMPTLTNETGPALVIENVVGSVVRLRRLVVADPQAGIQWLGGTRSDTLDLESVTVARSRGVGIGARALGALLMSSVVVDGAGGFGIDAESTAVVRFLGGRVDMVAGGGVGAALGTTLRHTNGDTLFADSVSLRGGALVVDTVTSVELTRAIVAETVGPLFELSTAERVVLSDVDFFRADANLDGFSVELVVNTTAMVSLDSVGLFQAGGGLKILNGASVDISNSSFLSAAPSGQALRLTGPPVVTVTATEVTNGDLWIEGGGVAASLTDVTLNQGKLYASSLDRLSMRGGSVMGAEQYGVEAQFVRVVSLSNVEITGTRAPACCSASFAVYVYSADSVLVDSASIHDNAEGALYTVYADTVSGYGNTIVANHLAPSQYSYDYTVYLLYPRVARFAQSVIDDRPAGSYIGFYAYQYGSGGNGSATIDTVSFYGSQFAVYAFSTGSFYNDTLTVRGSLHQPGMPGTIQGFVYAYYYTRLAVLGNTADSSSSLPAVYVFDIGSAEVRDNLMRYVRGGAYLDANGAGGAVEATGNTVVCSRVESGQTGLDFYDAPLVVTGNAIQGCANALHGYNYSYPQFAATLRGNSITGDSTYGNYGVKLEGNWVRPEIAGNTLGAGRFVFGEAAIALNGGSPGIDSARVDSNLVQDGLGYGIRTGGNITGVMLRGNTVERFGNITGDGAAIKIDHFVGGASAVDNRVRQNRVLGFELDAAGDTITLDSNVVVDDSLDAMEVTSTSITVVGRWNFIARNRRGVFGTIGTVSIDSTVIQQHTLVGADGPAGWNLANNYWGDPSGPRCGVGCPDGLGDSVAGGVSFSPFLSAAPGSVPIGAPPATAQRFSAGGAGSLTAARAFAPAVGATRAVAYPRVPASRSAYQRTPRSYPVPTTAPLAPPAALSPPVPVRHEP